MEQEFTAAELAAECPCEYAEETRDRLPALSPLDELLWRKRNSPLRIMNRAERRAWKAVQRRRKGKKI